MSYTMPARMELGEVKLKVSDLQRSLQFYQEVVGLKVLRQEERVALLTVDGVNPLVILEEIPNAVVVPRQSAAGLYHFAILLPSREALGLALRNLMEAEVSLGQADHLVSEALYIWDPDMNGIEIYRDRPREEWTYDASRNVVMASDPIDWEDLLKEAEGKAWAGLPVGTKMGHVHFHARDIYKMKEFYCDVMGFDIAANALKEMGAIFISAGGYHHHIGLNIWAGANAPLPPANGTGLAYYTIQLPTQDDVEGLVERLRNHGVSIDERDGAWYGQDPSAITFRLVLQDT
jgi:catechol 2,3-dioxygenase